MKGNFASDLPIKNNSVFKITETETFFSTLVNVKVKI
jgi:hypothetical protein